MRYDHCLVIFIFILLTTAEGANILGLLPLPLYSHTNTFMPIFLELARRGHNVTLYSVFPLKEPVKNLNHIVVDNIMPDGPPNAKEFLENPARNLAPLQVIGFWYFGTESISKVFQQKQILDLIDSNSSKFDLVIAETLFMQEPLVAFGHKFSAPVVNLNPAAPTSWVSYITGTPNPYSYVPDLRMASTDNMNFWERFSSTYLGLLDIFVAKYYGIPKNEALLKEYFSEELPPLIDMLRNTSLTLVDAHFSLGYPRPYHNNIVEIGGLSLETERVPIPKEMEEFMNNAENGVIYVSFGSWLKVSDLSPSIIDSFVKGFSKLKQRVLWKWNGDPLKEKSDNVLLSSWFPQNSILAHPKTKCFVTHGGVHSLFESISMGVPLVGIPVMADQPHNLKFIEKEGLGITLKMFDLTPEILADAINRVIEDPNFKENVIARSIIMKDRPALALKNAIYWIEYVINHHGARHLRPASLDISYAQYFLLDVLLLIGGIGLLAMATVIFFLHLTFRIICWLLCTSPKNKINSNETVKTVERGSRNVGKGKRHKETKKIQ